MQTGQVVGSSCQSIEGWDTFSDITQKIRANLFAREVLTKQQNSLMTDGLEVERQVFTNGFRWLIHPGFELPNRPLYQGTVGKQGIDVVDHRTALEGNEWVILERDRCVIYFDASHVATSTSHTWAVISTRVGAEVVDLQSGHSTVIHPPQFAPFWFSMLSFSIIDDVLLWVGDGSVEGRSHVLVWNCSNSCVPRQAARYRVCAHNRTIASIKSHHSAVAIQTEIMSIFEESPPFAADGILLALDAAQAPRLREVGRVRLAPYGNHGLFPLGPQLLATWDAYGLLTVWRFEEPSFLMTRPSANCVFRIQFDGFGGPADGVGTNVFHVWFGSGPKLLDLVNAAARDIRNAAAARSMDPLQDMTASIAAEEGLGDAHEENLPNHSEEMNNRSQHSKETELETAITQSMAEEELAAQENVYVAQAILRSKADAILVSEDDCVVVMRLKRIGQATHVRSILSNSAHLQHARELVLEAGCEVLPQWCAAVLLVPITQETLAETGVELRAHHIVARRSDFESICQALSEMPRRQRPSLYAPPCSATVAQKDMEDDGADEATIVSESRHPGFEDRNVEGECNQQFEVEIQHTFIHISCPKDISEVSRMAESEPCTSAIGQQPVNPRRWSRSIKFDDFAGSD